MHRCGINFQASYFPAFWTVSTLKKFKSAAFFPICPHPGLLPVLGPSEQYSRRLNLTRPCLVALGWITQAINTPYTEGFEPTEAE